MKFINIILFILGISLLSGCMEPPKPEELIAKTNDKYMMKTMVKYIKWGSRNPDMIVREVYISQLQGHTNFSISAALDEYRSKFDIMSEDMTRDYIKVAKSRGNIVKLYKNSVNKAISKVTPKGFYLDRGYDWSYYDLDPALIEYNKKGVIISVLLQKHKISKLGRMKNFLHYRYSEIISGNLAKKLEYVIGNDTLSNGFIREL